MAQTVAEFQPLDYTLYDFKNPETYKVRTAKGLSREIVEQISKIKDEPQWMLDYRLRAYETFVDKPMPDWGPDLSDLDFDAIHVLRQPARGGGHQEELGRPSGRHQKHLRQARHSQGRARVLRRRRGAV